MCVFMCTTNDVVNEKCITLKALGVNAARIVVTTCYGALLSELVHPHPLVSNTTNYNVYVANSIVQIFTCVFNQKLLTFDMYDILYKNQKVCNVCFENGCIQLLKDCMLHKPAVKLLNNNFNQELLPWSCVILKNGKGEATMKIDNEDLHFLKSHVVYVSTVEPTHYSMVIILMNNQPKLFSHFLLNITKLPSNMVIDHANRDSLDLRKFNLRPVTRARNAHNITKAKGTISSYIGVYPARAADTYVAYQTFERKRYHLGTFSSEIDAAKANDAFFVFKYQDITAQRNNVLTNKELQDALTHDSTPSPLKSIYGTGITKSALGFVATWSDDNYNKNSMLCNSLDEATKFRSDQLNIKNKRKLDKICESKIERDE